MWHRPQLLLATADLLLVAGALLFAAAAVLAIARLPLFSVREVAFVAPLRETQRPEVEQAVREVARGSFFRVDPERVRTAVERLPWVRRAAVRRVWPGRIAVVVEEHRAVARWGGGNAQLVNDYGEVFYASAAVPPSLKLHGPLGSAAEVLARYREYGALLAPVGQPIGELELSARLAWRIRLADGTGIELGREQQRAPHAERLARFVASYRELLDRGARARLVDLRYPNGYALRLAATPAID